MGIEIGNEVLPDVSAYSIEVLVLEPVRLVDLDTLPLCGVAPPYSCAFRGAALNPSIIFHVPSSFLHR